MGSENVQSLPRCPGAVWRRNISHELPLLSMKIATPLAGMKKIFSDSKTM